MSYCIDYEMAQISKLAYLEHTKISSDIILDVGSAECVIHETDTKIIIAVRGTELTEPRDIIRDLRIHKIFHIKGKVHKGFDKGAIALRLPLTELPYDKPLWFTGHSKGGAEATILSTYMAGLNYNVQGLVTFGCPRVGNKEFAKFVEDSIPYIHRYQNRYDCVPRHPWPIWGYRHVSKVRKLKYGTHSMDTYLTNLYDLALNEVGNG